MLKVKLVGNIHGDEVVGRELLLVLARVLCEQVGLQCVLHCTNSTTGRS